MKLRPIRVLPLTIGVAVLLLGVQAGSLWNAVPFGVATPAYAEEAVEKMAAKEEHAGEEAGQGADAKGGAHGGEHADDDEDKKDALADYTQEEIEILYELVERREILDQREAELVSREALIDAAEKRMEARVADAESGAADGAGCAVAGGRRGAETRDGAPVRGRGPGGSGVGARGGFPASVS